MGDPIKNKTEEISDELKNAWDKFASYAFINWFNNDRNVFRLRNAYSLIIDADSLDEAMNKIGIKPDVQSSIKEEMINPSRLSGFKLLGEKDLKLIKAYDVLQKRYSLQQDEENIADDNAINNNKSKAVSVDEALKNNVNATRVSGSHGQYLNSIISALDATASKLSKDSLEYQMLCDTLKNTDEVYKKYQANKVSYEEYKNSMQTLEESTRDYIRHCEKHPKIGSRRAERLKNANKILNICEAFDAKQTVRQYLYDNIALKYYATIVYSHANTLKGKEKNDFLEKYVGNNSEDKKRRAAECVKSFKAFKSVVTSTTDVDKLFYMNEEPIKTFNHINKLAKGESKEAISEISAFKKDIINKKDLAPKGALKNSKPKKAPFMQ